MDLVDAYLFLFFDSFLSSLILIPNSHMAFKVMLEMGGYNIVKMFSIALLGDGLGGVSNYLMGYIITYVQHNIRNKKASQKLISLMKHVRSKLFVLAFFSFVPVFGVLLTTASGFFRVKMERFLLVLILGRISYYLYLMVGT